MTLRDWKVISTLAAACVVISLADIGTLPFSGRAEASAAQKRRSKNATKADDALVKAVIQAHNRERAAEKLPPLKGNPKLEAAAIAHARDMSDHETMSHEGSDGSAPEERIERQGYRYHKVAENVAAGQESVKEVMKAWMNSPHHKKNILGDYTEIGVARAFSRDGTPYWATEFGRPWTVLDPETAASEVIEALNRERKQAKRPEFVEAKILQSVAQRHAHDMAAQDELARQDSDGMTPYERVQESGARYVKLGQEAASGLATAEDLVKSLMAKPDRKKHLMDDFRHIGVGYAATDTGVPYWSILLGVPAR
jgi:uncharacterized protein YkwD